MRIVWIVAGVIVFLIIWTFDPNAWRVRSRFPSAKIIDCYDYGWLVPAFLHSSWIPAHDLYEGKYLEIDLSDTTVDLRQFDDIPFFLIGLDHCRVTNLPSLPLGYDTHRDILFHDCDLSGVPPYQLSKIYFPKGSTPSHATGEMNPQ